MMTAEQFRAWPGDGTGRLYQLIDGELVAMAPPTVEHGTLQARLAIRLGQHLATHRPGCEVVVTPGVQPRPDAAHNVRIPDLAVTCAPRRGPFLADPLLIVEILSPSNIRETREAVRACLTLPSLREVLILSSIAIAAEVHLRDEAGIWPAEPRCFGPGGILTLDSLGFACPMDELYAGLGLT